MRRSNCRLLRKMGSCPWPWSTLPTPTPPPWALVSTSLDWVRGGEVGYGWTAPSSPHDCPAPSPSSSSKSSKSNSNSFDTSPTCTWRCGARSGKSGKEVSGLAAIIASLTLRRGRKVSGHESPFYSSTSRPTHQGHLERQLTTSTSSVQIQKSFSPSPSDYFQKTLLSASTSKKNMSSYEDNNQMLPIASRMIGVQSGGNSRENAPQRYW